MPPAGNSRLYRFGIYEVDVRSGKLRKNGARLKLQEQPFQVLAMLLERPGEVLTRGGTAPAALAGRHVR